MTWLLSLLGLSGVGLALAFIPGALPALVKAATYIWEAICKYPREAAIIALCVLSAVLWRGWSHADDRADTWHRAHDLRVQAEELAAKAQEAMNAAHVAKAKEAANHAQTDYDESGPKVRDDLAAYVARNRLRPGACAASESHPAAESADPRVPADLPAPALVSISEPDLQACTDWTRIGVGAHNLAVEQIERGVAEVVK